LVHMGRRERGNGEGEWIRYKYCVHIYVNGQWYVLKLFQERGEGRIKENDGGGKFKIYIYMTWYIVRTFVNAIIYPHSAQLQKKRVWTRVNMKTSRYINFKFENIKAILFLKVYKSKKGFLTRKWVAWLCTP
jgi:hypothetical protein